MSSHTNLQERLDRYGITARGQIGRGPSVGEVAAYAAAAGVGLVMAGGADAQIIYSGIRNLEFNIDPAAVATSRAWATNIANVASAAIDLDGGGADATVRLSFLGNVAPGSATANYYGFGGLVVAGSARFLGISGGSASLGGSNVPKGAQIGSSGVFSASSAGLVRGEALISGGPQGPYDLGHFQLGQKGIVGIQLASGNYGWIRLRIDDRGDNNPFVEYLGTPPAPLLSGARYPDRITVIDWAYESIAGDPIEAPVPTPLALLAAGALGIAAFRRRKAGAVRSA